MRMRTEAAMAVRKRVRAQDYSKMQGSFYRPRRIIRGGGEGGSKTKESAEENGIRVRGANRSGAESATGLGNTNTIAPVTAGSFGWQHATVQSIAVVRA